MTGVRIRESALETMVRHAREALPDECCGLLIGDDDGIEEARRARNAHRSPTRFLIDPADHFAAIRAARRQGRRVRGAYHSHPAGPSIPSARDAAELSDPSLVYVIVSLAACDPEARAYVWKDGNFEPLALVPVP